MKKKIRIIFGVVLFTVNIYNAYSQSNDPLIHKFHVSMVSYLQYPDSLKKNKIPVITILKIDINETGTVKDMELSDSADSIFKKTFIENKKFLDIGAIAKYVKHEKLKNAVLLLPIRLYIFGNETVNINLLNKTMRFQGLNFKGKAVILPPLDNVFTTKTDY